MTGFAPGPAKVATRMSGFGMGPTHDIAGLHPAISIECRAACRIVIAGTRPAARVRGRARVIVLAVLSARAMVRKGSRGCAGRDGSIRFIDGSLSAPAHGVLRQRRGQAVPGGDRTSD